MTTTSAPADSKVSQSVLALKAWHQLDIDSVAAAANMSPATLHRRFAGGKYMYAEVKALAAYFGLSIEALESGEFSLNDSALASANRKRPRGDSNSRHTAYNSALSAQLRPLIAA